MDDATRRTIREGLSASRHLANLAANDCLIDRDFDRLLLKIQKGLEAAVEASFEEPPPLQLDLPYAGPSGDFTETIERLRALGVRVSPSIARRWGGLDYEGSRRPCQGDSGPSRVRVVRGLGVIDGDRE